MGTRCVSHRDCMLAAVMAATFLNGVFDRVPWHHPAMLYRTCVGAMVALTLTLTGCGSDGGDDEPTGPQDWPLATAPAATTPEEGIRREVFLVNGYVPAANPDTGDETPTDFNFTQVVRYRQDAANVEPTAILIGYPGFLGGAASWEFLARHLVRRSVAAGKPIEVWAIDRRSNLLEDLTGLDTAEMTGNPEIAYRYYFGLDTINGERFPGFLFQSELGYMSEWGLETHVEDLHRVISLVPEADRQGHVFLLGHSLGASFAETYAAWRFRDGTRGAEELAGLVLIDGLLGDSPITEDEYQNGTGGGFGSVPGLDKIRTGNLRYFELPFFGVSALAQVEVLSLRTLVDPDAVIEDDLRDDSLRILMQMGDDPVPAMTNAAALGFALDQGSNSITFTAVSCGRPIGGALEDYENALGDGTTLYHPTDSGATYSWQDATTDDADEFTPIANLAHSFVDGRTNFAEWYFPTRLPLDLGAVGGANVPDDGYQASAGLRAFDGALNDAPILAIATELVLANEYDQLVGRIATTLGKGRKHAGAGRDSELGLRILDAAELTHVDPTIAADRPDNPVPEAVMTFVYEHVLDGTVQLQLPSQ